MKTRSQYKGIAVSLLAYCFSLLTQFTISIVRLFHMGNLLLLIGLSVVMFFMLSFCWSYCGEEDREKSNSDGGHRVIAREVRPGLIIVQNSKDAEETLRIIQEYDAMQGQMSPNRFPQLGNVPEAANTRATYLQAACPSYYSSTTQVATKNIPTETLIDIDISELGRPPPYAPST